ncbi:MAG TPA: DUF72 domain-containing protein [Solirubrobacterales bacterium]|nr:DUF72 domain-containing protein [Solirubrobacterales bacterium]
MAIVVGTSSWADPGFVRHWYPQGMAPRERLPFYAERFEAVELNSSFYAIPAESTVEGWDRATPDGFLFDVKLHRLLSHHAAQPKDLPRDLRKDVETNERGRVLPDPALVDEVVRRTAEAMRPLNRAGKLSSYLLQLTPAFDPRRNELEELLPVISGLAPVPVAVEFRRRSWASPKRLEQVIEWLSAHHAVLVCVDSPPGDHVTIFPPVDAVTDERFACMRCHGRNTEGYLHGRSVAERFDYDYPEEELREIAGRARALAEEAESVHVMFNNNARELAPKAARSLRALLGQDPGPEPR